MIELKPKTENCFKCPECKSSEPAINDIIMQSIYVLADCTCRECGLEFYQTFPVGHSVDDHLSVRKASKRFYPGVDRKHWLSDVLYKAHYGIRTSDVTIKKLVFKECREVVVLNTLDYLYGHVLLKLYNYQYHLNSQGDLGLIIIIPKMFEWLIPHECAEAWVVDLTLSELAYEYTSIQAFVANEFKRFSRIYLSKAYSHPDFTTVDIERLTGIRPFDLGTFSKTKPTITFILREDRWWLGSVPLYWVYRGGRKLGWMKWVGSFLAGRQNGLVRKAMRQIRRRLPDARFFVAGLGKTGSFDGLAVDDRKRQLDAATEIEWCKIYAQSHVVVGVHGSNMLLPTAFAAGCVEILPEDRYGNMVQDISVRYNDRRQLFFYRFAEQYVSPQTLANKVAAIVEDFEKFDKDMCRNLYAVNGHHKGYYDHVSH